MRFKIKAAPITHIPVLIEMVRRTTGDILEMGIGVGSSPLLHEICRGRKLISYDNNKEICDIFSDFKSDWHEICFVENWANAPIEKPWGLVFIDHAPASRRRHDIIRLKDCANYVICHDTEPQVDRFYRYRHSFSLYKYRHDYTVCLPHTTILSNKDDRLFHVF